ncbi:MAG: glycosyltransferase family 2 protein [Burkholderiales bacterium]|nr:glycosyltransferase family 2 protein [Burkholderiales bacterium]
MTIEPEATPLAGSTARPRIVAVLACFNRRALTLACLEALEQSAARAGAELEAIVVDDASQDGTAEAVQARFPWVEVVAGSGALYWNRGMHKGFALAMRRQADHYLWLNDDTVLVPEALSALLSQWAALMREQGRQLILVGATADRESGTISYGGRVRDSRLRPFHYRLVWHAHEPVPCHVMEGNCVLIPREVAQRVGNLDPVYEHAMGDTDYALRARKAGFDLFVCGGVMGYCPRNTLQGTYADRRVPFRKRWHLVLSRKGLPIRSWMHFCRRHGGPLWPLHFAWPYTKLLMSGLRALLDFVPFEP